MKHRTHSSAKKRFRLTGTGKIKRSKAARNHLLMQKSKRQKAMGVHMLDVSPSFIKKVRKVLAQ